jgi:hypothetical protein
MRARRDLLLAIGVATLAMAVYLRTMFPGVGGGGDMVKFQYLGSVLGTAHPPGYPLYILVSYAFSHLPFATPAYRINLMSAVFAAAAAALIFLALVRLDCRRFVAVAIALALAFDRYVWGKATGAEVYSLAGFLAALIAWLAVRWAATGRDRDLYFMVAAFALSLGNHLTVAMLFPAIALFVLVVRPRAIRPTTVVVSALICLAGLAQYGYIMLRTHQHSPHLEASATNLRELYATVRATKYADDIFAFTTRQLTHDRLPQLWQRLQIEMNPAGVLLVVIGLIAAAIRRLPTGLLFGLGAAGVLLLTLNVQADADGFLVPAAVLAWPLAGLGLDAVWSMLAPAGRPGVAAAAVVAVALSIWQIDRNYKVNDHHRRTYEMHYLDALFSQLEDRVAFVSEVYPIEQLILYKVFGEHANGSRAVAIIPSDLPTVRTYDKSGFTIYAFSNGRQALEGRGFGFEPIQLREPSAAGSNGAAIDMSPIPLFRVARRADCLPMGNAGWREVSSLVSEGRAVLRIDNYRPFDSTAILYVGGKDLSQPPSMVISQGPVEPVFSVTAFRTSAPRDLAGLTKVLAEDAMPAADALRRQPEIQRLVVRVNDRGEFLQAALTLGGRPEVAWVRASVDLNNPLRATVCGWSARDFFLDERRIDEQVPITSDGDALFGRGWRPAERADGGLDVRWTSGPRAEIALPLARVSPLHIKIRAMPAPGGDAGRTIDVTINGHPAAAQRLAPEWRTYEWDIPSDELRQGLNRVTIDVAAGSAQAPANPQTLTVAVGELVLARRTGT